MCEKAILYTNTHTHTNAAVAVQLLLLLSTGENNYISTTATMSNATGVGIL